MAAAAACPSYPEALHAVLAFLRDYAEVHISSLGVSYALWVRHHDGVFAKKRRSGHAWSLLPILHATRPSVVLNF